MKCRRRDKLNQLIIFLLVQFILNIFNIKGADNIETIEIKEGSQIGDTLLDVARLFSLDSTSPNDQFTFSTTPTSLKSFLTLLNLKILTVQPINHGTFCASPKKCDLSIDVIFTNSSGYKRNSKVKLKFLNSKPPLSSEVKSINKINAENDQKPKFMKKLYEGRVKNDEEVGTFLVQVTAKNSINDEGKNVRYYFPPKTLGLYGNLFEINEKSGVITLKSTLKSSPPIDSEIKFLVMADLGLNPIPLSTTVQIDVINSNTHQPHITIESLYSGSDLNNLIVEENNNKNHNLARILVSDGDVGEAGMVDCKVDSQEFELIRLNHEEFQLIVKQVLDHESQGVYKFNVFCRDFGKPSLSNVSQITLIVTDLDDNPPVFHKNIYLVNLVENSLVGTEILKLDVTDRDSHPQNKKVSFFIEPHFEHLFSIDQATGMIKTKNSFDRETVSHYNFHVFAKSGDFSRNFHLGNSSSFEHITKAIVNVTIVDVDDETAKFSQPWFKFEVFENQPLGTTVGRVVAVDLDLPPNNHFMYSLSPPYRNKMLENLPKVSYKKDSNLKPTTLPFYVETKTGEIKTTTSLDRERMSKYDFKVYAGNESTTVYVEVQDINDNPPIFEIPPHNSCLQPVIIGIQGNLTLSRPLSKVVASDIDELGSITFSIVAGNDFNHFGIDEKTGDVFWNSYMPGLTNSQGCKTQLKLRAHDSLHLSETACLELVFEECLSHLLRQQRQQEELTKKQSSTFLSPFTNMYLLIIVVVLVCCVATVIILTSAICITRHKTRKLKKKSQMMMRMHNEDLKSNMHLSRSEVDTLLVLNRSHDNESSDQLTGILVSIKSAEQLQRLQLRSLAPSRDSLMSTSTSMCKDADSGYADVASPV